MAENNGAAASAVSSTPEQSAETVINTIDKGLKSEESSEDNSIDA